MRSINAVELRQSVGKVVEEIERTGKPIILEKHNQPVAVIISLKDFEERFVEKSALEGRLNLVKKIDDLARPAKDKTPAEKILRELRDSK